MRAKLVLLVLPLFMVGALAFGSSSADASGQEMMKKDETVAKPAPRRQRARGRAQRGVPTGVSNCVNRLIQIAEAEPLVEYGGQAEQIVNNGLLWNDPKSKCYIGDDSKLKLKVSEMAKAWRTKDAATVRSLLQEIRSAVPQT
jgi:hypothetical protein